jgi:hypothetical protein
MAARVRFAVVWATVLAACQMGFALAEEGSWIVDDGEGPAAAGACARPTMDCPACWGEYCRYAPAAWAGYDRTEWSSAPAAPVRQIWTVDYRVRPMLDSVTSYEFGAPDLLYAPLSRLDFELDSIWHGFQIGVELPGWRVHFEWLMPMGDRIDGDMADYMQIHTTGTHRLLNEPLDVDLKWNNGVIVQSDQTTMTGFVRYRL